MNITTKFNLGQQVWMISSCPAQRIVHCDICNRTGTITIANESFICPKCNGTSKRPEYIGLRYYVSGKSIIGKIEVERYLDKYQNGHGSYENKNNYMLESTGIGSGIVWTEEYLFASEKEALKECEIRNAGKIFEDDK